MSLLLPWPLQHIHQQLKQARPRRTRVTPMIAISTTFSVAKALGPPDNDDTIAPLSMSTSSMGVAVGEAAGEGAGGEAMVHASVGGSMASTCKPPRAAESVSDVKLLSVLSVLFAIDAFIGEMDAVTRTLAAVTVTVMSSGSTLLRACARRSR